MDNLMNLIISLLQLGVFIAVIAGFWKVFEKANYPGWASLIPIYNGYIILKIAGKPGWWLILAFIPLVNLIMLIIPFNIAEKFGKGIGYGFGLLFLPFIFYPWLGFGSARYRGQISDS
jgi:hypothetical protein